MSENIKKFEIGLSLGNCHACQGCVELNPDIFEWDEENDQPRLLKTSASRDEIQHLINCCPKDCIYLVE